MSEEYDSIDHDLEVESWKELWMDELIEKIHALNELNLDQSFVTTKRELLEKLK